MHGGNHAGDVDIDFSVSLNPYASDGVSKLIEDAIKEGIGSAGRYPDIDQKAVREEIGRAEGISPDCIVAGCGASELILAVARTVAPKTALLIEPCFSGYRYALESLGGCKIKQHLLKEENGFALTDDILTSMTGEIDIIFLCDPWNPTGQNIDEELLDKVLKRADELGIAVLLDQSFYMLSDKSQNYTPEKMQKWNESYDHLFTVRSYTKYFSLPGIRMGYAITSRKSSKMLKKQLPEWNLPALSSALMRRISTPEKLGDFHDKTLGYVRDERRFLTENLSDLGYKIFESDSNFILIKGHKDTYEKLINEKIAVRKCDDFSGLGENYFRIAIKSHEENSLLIDALKRQMD